MRIKNRYRFFLLTIGLGLCLFGCDAQQGGLLLPDNILNIFI